MNIRRMENGMLLALDKSVRLRLMRPCSGCGTTPTAGFTGSLSGCYATETRQPPRTCWRTPSQSLRHDVGNAEIFCRVPTLRVASRALRDHGSRGR